MDVIHFDSKDSMRAHLARSINARLHPLQAAMRPGDHWVDFRDIANRRVNFGWIADDDELLTMLTGAGMTKAVAEATRENLRAGHDLGVFYGQRFDRAHTAGVFDVVYVGRVWPIEDRLFDAAQEVEFDIDRLPEWAKILMQVAFTSSRHHARMKTALASSDVRHEGVE